MNRIYLDHSATTPLAPEVLEAMLPYLQQFFGNPSSLHSFGREVKVAIEEAREKLAAFMGVKPREIYFTSGATESNNWAISGTLMSLKNKGNHIVTTVIEHSSVLDVCRNLGKNGFNISFVKPDNRGKIYPEAIKECLRDSTVLVSVMYANNEVGTINPIIEIGELVNGQGILLHCDAVQGAGTIPKPISDLPIDLLSISAHKFYGPKGVGALYIRSGSKISRMLFGGGQERRLRAGTENVAGIVGLGKAAELLAQRGKRDEKNFSNLRDLLWQGINRRIHDVVINGDLNNGLSNLLNCTFSGAEGESVVLSLDMSGIAISAGSACAVGTMESSHVLQAMDLKPERVKGAVRFSFGRGNSEKDVEIVIDTLVREVERLRQLNPSK